MQLQSNYEQHVELSKQLKMSESFTEVRAPFKEEFEKIHAKAKEENINMSNAKEFLNSLSKEELSTLQNYTRLADEINVGNLSDEGAYNLLLHHYEKFDFNNDGIVSDGLAQTRTMLPPNMPYEDKKALVETLNEMDEDERFTAMFMLYPPKFKFENGEIIPDHSNEVMTYDKLMEHFDRIVNPPIGDYSSPELKKLFSIFQERFEKNYENITSQKEQTTPRANEIQAVKAKLVNQA